MPQVSGTMEAASQTDDDGARADGAVRVASSEPGFYRPMLELLFFLDARLVLARSCAFEARSSAWTAGFASSLCSTAIPFGLHPFATRRRHSCDNVTLASS